MTNKRSHTYVIARTIKTYLATDKERLFRNHWTKIFSNNDFDYDHVTEIENNLIDNFEHVRTYDYGALYRLDRDFPPITTIELTNTLRASCDKLATRMR